MRVYVGALILILLASVSFAAEHETLEQLIARAQSAPEGQKSELYLEICDREVKIATDAYAAGKSDDGSKALENVVNYADQAHAIVLKIRKKLPHTEIKIRRVASRLRDLKQNVDADDQVAVQSAIDKLESFRTELLKGMFGSKGSEKKQ